MLDLEHLIFGCSFGAYETDFSNNHHSSQKKWRDLDGKMNIKMTPKSPRQSLDQHLPQPGLVGHCWHW